MCYSIKLRNRWSGDGRSSSVSKWPVLHVYFEPPDQQGRASLRLTLPSGKGDTAKIELPFSLSQIAPLIRALNVRQYPDYPEHDRLMLQGEARHELIKNLQTLNLWIGDADNGMVPADVHLRVGQQLGLAFLRDASMRRALGVLRDMAIQAGGGEVCLHFAPRAEIFAELPWELTHDGLQPMLLCHGTVLNCTRVLTFTHALPPETIIRDRIRILTIAPQAQMSEDARQFERLARRHLRDAMQGLPVDIEVLPQTTMPKLRERLVRDPAIDVIDYYGHGKFAENGAVLLMDDDMGASEPVSVTRLAALPRLPWLMVLHACGSGQLRGDEPLTGLAAALSSVGVRAVVAMQLTTRATAATHVVAPVLYRELARHRSVQQAVAAVRQSLYIDEPDGASWYLPVLYLRHVEDDPVVLVYCPEKDLSGFGLTIPDLCVCMVRWS